MVEFAEVHVDRELFFSSAVRGSLCLYLTHEHQLRLRSFAEKTPLGNKLMFEVVF